MGHLVISYTSLIVLWKISKIIALIVLVSNIEQELKAISLDIT